MSVSDPTGPAPPSFAGDVLHMVRYYLPGRVGVAAIAAAALGLGAYYNWSWLVAAGLAPILVMMLPCAAMCAIGLRKSGQSQNRSDEPTSSQKSRDDSGGQSASRPMTESGTSPVSDQPAQVKSCNRKGSC